MKIGHGRGHGRGHERTRKGKRKFSPLFHFLFIFFASSLCADPLFETRDRCTALLYDLDVARYWDEKMNERLPVVFNHILTAGYFTTPSARMTDAGEIAFGGAHVPPYNLLSARIQPFRLLDFSANYRLFSGVDDPGLSPHGFGDYADRGANVKYALMIPEDSQNVLPGLAIGVEDFMGSKKFLNYYIVATQVLINIGLEMSLGWGSGRYTHGSSRGFFGGAAYFPFWECGNRWVEGLALAAEYDPIDYSNPNREPHPDGRVSNTPINVGIKWNFSDLITASASYIRGDAFACAGALHYNWGETFGVVPKINDPLPYVAPRNIEPIGCYRPEEAMIQELYYAFEDQGFLLMEATMDEENNCRRLWISLINQRYRQEHIARERIEHLLAALTPTNVDSVIVCIESFGLPCHQYVYSRELLKRYCANAIGLYEFNLLTPRMEAEPPCGHTIFYQRLDPWKTRISPRLETFFGSKKGKFKYDFGVKADVEGFLPYDIFYECQASYTLLSTIHDVGDFDVYNPSQLPNVLTDYVNYRKRRVFSTDRAYLQKSWNCGGGFFTRAAGGYFQVNYAGLAGEVLYYPAWSNLAIGLDGAVLKKRRYNGLWFQSKLRKLEGYTPTYVPYTVLNQFFLSLYLDIPEWKVATKVSGGGFLAHDKGGRFEVTRYFDSGLRVTLWLTFTNAGDSMHGESFYNRGIAIELPLDFFSRCSHRRVWNYGLAAWLRDAGAFIPIGKSLFETVNRERRW